MSPGDESVLLFECFFPASWWTVLVPLGRGTSARSGGGGVGMGRFGLSGLTAELSTSRRGLTPRGSLECNPEIPAFPGEEN